MDVDRHRSLPCPAMLLFAGSRLCFHFVSVYFGMRGSWTLVSTEYPSSFRAVRVTVVVLPETSSTISCNPDKESSRSPRVP